jgi:parallel beta-helix repeat protein
MKNHVLLIFVLAFLSTIVIVRFISPVISYPEETKLLMEVDLPVHNIDSSKNFSTIQAAINDNETLDGHTILVDAGTYVENVVVDKSISLIGENRSNTIIDGNRNGIVVWVRANNVVISNFTIRNGARTISNPMVIPGNGIHISGCRNCTIVGNIITNNAEDGIMMYSATNCTIVGNIIANNAYIGIEIQSGSGNILRDNSMINNTFNFRGRGFQDIDTSNTVNGKPICYWVNEHDKQVPPDAGYVAIINSSNVTVKNLNLTNNYEGVLIANSNNILIDGVNISSASRGIIISSSHHNNVSASTILNSHNGIYLAGSNSNTIKDSTISKCTFGIFLEGGIKGESINNFVSGNTITACSYSSIWIFTSHNNWIRQNSVSKSHAIHIYDSHDNLIEANLITNNYGSVCVYDSYDNTIISNTIALSSSDIYFCRSTNNVIYHNNFINNTNQAFDHIGGNIYDNGYPSGGNYWSDYTGVDEKSGPNQDQPGSDGIGDTPYTPHHNVEDRYPLMGMFSDFSVTHQEETYHATTICNSTISEFQFDDVAKTINFNVTGKDGTLGFCRVTIPDVIVQALWQGNYTVLVDGKEPITINNWTDGTYTYMYFTYLHSEHEVIIVPEFPTWTSMLLILIILTVAIAIYKQRLLKTPIH